MMKKRLISCLLAVFLLMGTVIPAGAANGSAAFQYLVDCAKQGSYDAAAKTFSNNYNMGSAGSLRIS